MSIDKLVVSTILGDGHVCRRGVVKFHHSIVQKDYLLYKVSLLNNYGFKFRTYDTKSLSYGEIRDFVKADGYASSDAKQLRAILYPKGVKIAPREYTEQFGFLEWAIIYMDDGRENKLSHYNSLIDKKRVRKNCQVFVNRYEMSVESFDTPSKENLVDSLSNLGVESKVDKNGRIVISRAKSKEVFYEGVRNFVVPSMLYKMSALPNLSYVSQ